VKRKVPFALVILGLIILGLCLVVFARGDPTEEFIISLVKSRNRDISDGEAREIAKSSLKWCQARGLSLWSVIAIMEQESNFYAEAISPTECRGLMQLSEVALQELLRQGYIPSYDLGRILEIDYNISLGTAYYLFCVRLANNDRREAIARYYMTSKPEDPDAQKYADGVLAKRAIIVREFEEFQETRR